ncbi:MAG TPA: helix-hairpin-helix domain-containing protein [Bacteroidales bacterium]|nr:helix-hairpin-helix domain-containing protein [Bacteroidales bacterium]
MKTIKKNKDSDDLLSVPGIGKNIAQDLHVLGIHHVHDLAGHDPEILYKDLCREYNSKIDPCVLYTFRCAVYYAENDNHDPELLKWWNWKNLSDNE